MTRFEVRTESQLAPAVVWAAVTDFTDDRPRLWPFIDRSLYKVHSVEPGHADVQEGSKSPLGRVWAREHYTWDDATMELRGTVAESNIFEPGGTATFRVEPRDGGGSILHEAYDRTRIGWRGRIMNGLMGPSRITKFVGDGRAKTYEAILARPPGPN
jgi:hypothetical protein